MTGPPIDRPLRAVVQSARIVVLHTESDIMSRAVAELDFGQLSDLIVELVRAQADMNERMLQLVGQWTWSDGHERRIA